MSTNENEPVHVEKHEWLAHSSSEEKSADKLGLVRVMVPEPLEPPADEFVDLHYQILKKIKKVLKFYEVIKT